MLLSNWFLNGIQAIVMHTLWPLVHGSVVLLLLLTFAWNPAVSSDKTTILWTTRSNVYWFESISFRLSAKPPANWEAWLEVLILCAFHKIFMSFFRFICRHKETEDKNAAGCCCCFLHFSQIHFQSQSAILFSINFRLVLLIDASQQSAVSFALWFLFLFDVIKLLD